jgi:long-subunit acyl-CoA synthetase (AMP-forming)
MAVEMTINDVFRNRVARYGDRLAVEKKRNGRWEQASWTQYYDRSRSAGLGLHALGVARGDRVALISENRLEWLYTDMGAISDEGFVSIVDRKKDLIITSGGKNVSPQKIENLFLSDPLFSLVIVIGEGRKYLTALVNINLEEAQDVARKQGIAFGKGEDLLEKPEFMSVVNTHVSGLNSLLSRYETIKRYAVVRHAFSKEAGELTDTLKIKRRVVREKYREAIDAMYDEEKSGPVVVP